MRGDVPLRRSLLVKLMALAAVVSACSITATAWLTVRITAVGIQHERGQALADDAQIYDALLGYAATHHDWAGAAGTVRDLARRSGHRVTVTDEKRVVLLDSGGFRYGTPENGPAPERSGPDLPTEATATVDPLAVDGTLVAGDPAVSATVPAGSAGQTVESGGTPAVGPGAASSPAPVGPGAASSPAPVGPGAASSPAPVGPGATGCPPHTRCLLPSGGPYPAAPSTIDSRAVGPFRLTAPERSRLHAVALRIAGCYRDRLHLSVPVVETRSGRSVLRLPAAVAYLPTDCPSTALDAPTPTEARALAQLDGLVDTCLARRHVPPVRLNPDLSWDWQDAARSGTSDQPATAPGAQQTAAVGSCVETARREQLAPYVAPPALLFVSSPGGAPTTFLDLSPGNRARIVEVTGLVLLLTVAVTVLVGTRMVRPLRALAQAARRMTDGDLTARVKVRAGDEIGGVAAAFNTMSEQREQSEELRKAMVSDVAHELRSPLANIRGWLEAAEDGLVVPDRDLVGSLLDEAVLLQHVIDDLRDLSAADAGELRLHIEQVEVADLVEQVATAHRGNADAAGVTLLTAAERQPAVDADPVRLRQAIGNLVSNAVRHTPPGGTVTLRAHRAEDRAVIEVADTGSGIAPDDLQRVFDRFWRAEKSRNRQTGGSGLGLSIVRKLVEAHGGSVAATSEPGRGSVFVLTLPAPREADALGVDREELVANGAAAPGASADAVRGNSRWKRPRSRRPTS
ncbi:sensor histidine kinase [Streptacidiphilus griseoplanus]|uniref:sensor histidine kinase n=1 Tax=Peterkaempfera griseoplana TaxID=66896 RepID=UPI0007C7F412|nr:HAMP domain-containing sensor histidine kinase [Peterkaempfera griseoplana]